MKTSPAPPPTDKEKIEKILDELGITAFHLTQELGLSKSTIYHVVSGKNNLSMKLISQIVTKFPNVNKTYLLKGTGTPLIEEKSKDSDEYVIVKKKEFEKIKKDIENIYELLKKLNQ